MMQGTIRVEPIGDGTFRACIALGTIVLANVEGCSSASHALALALDIAKERMHRVGAETFARNGR